MTTIAQSPPLAYSAAARAFHWLTLALLALAFGIEWTVDDLPQSIQPALIDLHRSVGLVVWMATLARLAYRQVRGVPPEPELPGWQVLASRLTHALLYALLLAEPLLGWAYTDLRGQPGRLFWMVDLPQLLAPADRSVWRMVRGWHELAANLMLVVVAVHAAAALYHHYVRRDPVLQRMLGRA